MASLALVPNRGGDQDPDVSVSLEFTDEDLAQLYGFLKADGSLRTIFWLGQPTLTEFIGMYSRENAAMLHVRPDGKKWQIAGLGWINSVRRVCNQTEDRTVEIGFGLRKEFRRLQYSLSLGRRVLGVAFDKSPFIISAVGVTPEPNKGAVMFARLLGMEIFGPIPQYATWDGIPCGAYVSSITRGDFYGR